MKKWRVVAGLLFVSSFLSSQKTSVIDDAGVGIKSFNANQAYLGGDINKALKLYSECNSLKPNDGTILFHIGQCHYSMDDYDAALDYLQKSEAADSNAHADLHLTLGLTLLQEDQPDNAMKEFLWHKRKHMDDPKKLKEDEIEHLIGECKTAKDFESHPVNVKIRNGGEAINSEPVSYTHLTLPTNREV